MLTLQFHLQCKFYSDIFQQNVVDEVSGNKHDIYIIYLIYKNII